MLASIALLMVTLPAWGASKSDDEQTIRNATTVLQAMVSSNDIPKSVLEKADCIMILPSVKKFAVGIGGTGGRGPLVCREGSGFSGKWSPPAMYGIGGASAGFQVGGKASDVVIAIMASGAVDKVLNGKVKVGSDVSAAAGPGAQAGTLSNIADMLTYSRSSGLFAGASLDGASLDPDANANERLYSKTASAKDIVSGGVKPTTAGQELVSLLDSKLGTHSH
ncbi:MAG TPA: lipid-binding SYLF domain-containing protein [Candidatus Methylomirabilis sp.]|nr:lipid-binding SYLF domain-containing protein [Candidatus Methylomirabilis sp.]